MAATAVRLDSVTKRFGAKTVLNNISFEVNYGEGFAILGRSGTGKSVTLKHIIGLMTPDRGRVFVEGRDIGSLSRRELSAARTHVGFLFQNAALFDSISVGENVAFPLRRHLRLSNAAIRARAMEKLDQVGLGREYDAMPADLSGGMRKRAGLARAMALDPKILLADEPSAGLDPLTTEEIDDLLLTQKTQGGTTLILVTHNIPSAIKLADRIALIHEGRFIAEGRAEELERSEDELVRTFLRSSHAG